ncbi:MAG: DUF2442 domain-containing protein [Bacteroidetes bacterium]|nr:DUF2442 domain-containing protein [Bacteroidota bacterium]
MLIKVTKAVYKRDYIIEFTFNNGIKSEVDLKDSFRGPVFDSLKDLNYFKKFKLNRWTIEWENGADFAPEYLYELATKTAMFSIKE